MDIAPIFRFSLALANSRREGRTAQIEPASAFSATDYTSQGKSKNRNLEKPAIQHEDAVVVNFSQKERPGENSIKNAGSLEEKTRSAHKQIVEQQFSNILQETQTPLLNYSALKSYSQKMDATPQNLRAPKNSSPVVPIALKTYAQNALSEQLATEEGRGKPVIA